MTCVCQGGSWGLVIWDVLAINDWQSLVGGLERELHALFPGIVNRQADSTAVNPAVAGRALL